MSRKRPRTEFHGTEPNTERLCIRGIASAAANLPNRDVIALFAKVGLNATEVHHCLAKDVSFVTVAKAPSKNPTSEEELNGPAELRNTIERAVRILQGSRWRGVVLRSIELSNAEHYLARLHRTWDAEKQRSTELAAIAAAEAHTAASSLPPFHSGEVLYIKAPIGMGFVQVSTAPDCYWDGDGDPKEVIFSSSRIKFTYSDDEDEEDEERQVLTEFGDEEDDLSATSEDDLSATSSDEDSDVEDEEVEKTEEIEKIEKKKNEVNETVKVVQEEEVDWGAWLKEQDEDDDSKNNSENEDQSEEEEEDDSDDGNEDQDQDEVDDDNKNSIDGRGKDMQEESIVVDKNILPNNNQSHSEEEWSGSSSEEDEDEDGLNLLQRLKGGGKKKRKAHDDDGPKTTTAIDIKDYDEEAWNDGDGENIGRKKKRKKRKQNTNTKDSSSSTSTTATAAATTDTAPKSKKLDPVAQNKKRLIALAKKKKEKERAAAAVTKALAAAPKSKKLTFSSSDEEDDEEDNINLRSMRAIENDSTGKIVMFSDDEGSDNGGEDGGNEGDTNKFNFLGGKNNTATPCPTSDEARFQLKEDYQGYAGKKLMKLQRRVGADSRFRMGKDFMEEDEDSGDDDDQNDDTEFEKFQVPVGPHIPKEHTSSIEPGGIGNVDEEVDESLNALRSVLGKYSKQNAVPQNVVW